MTTKLLKGNANSIEVEVKEGRLVFEGSEVLMNILDLNPSNDFKLIVNGEERRLKEIGRGEWDGGEINPKGDEIFLFVGRNKFQIIV